MTKNQIDYWSLVESERHNRRSEREESRANRARERENTRSNVARETEQNRANLASEQLSRERNAISAETNTINRLYNERSLAETERRNLVSEELSRAQLGASLSSIEANRYASELNYSAALNQVGLGYSQLEETARRNQAVEAEEHRRNVAQEGTNRYAAVSNRMNAQTNQQKFEQQRTEWLTWGEKQAKSSYLQTLAQTNLAKAQTKKAQAEASVVKLNAVSNLLGGAGRLFNNVSRRTTK